MFYLPGGAVADDERTGVLWWRSLLRPVRRLPGHPTQATTVEKKNYSCSIKPFCSCVFPWKLAIRAVWLLVTGIWEPELYRYLEFYRKLDCAELVVRIICESGNVALLEIIVLASFKLCFVSSMADSSIAFNAGTFLIIEVIMVPVLVQRKVA